MNCKPMKAVFWKHRCRIIATISEARGVGWGIDHEGEENKPLGFLKSQIYDDWLNKLFFLPTHFLGANNVESAERS